LDYKQVEEVGGLVAGVSSQLESLSAGTILGPGTGKAA